MSVPVVVVVEEFRAPPRVQRRDSAHASLARYVFEEFAVVAEQGVPLVRQGVDEYVRSPVVVIVGKIRPHASKRPPILVIGHARQEREFLKTAALQIAEELLRERIVRDEHVIPAVAVVVVECDA